MQRRRVPDEGNPLRRNVLQLRTLATTGIEPGAAQCSTCAASSYTNCNTIKFPTRESPCAGTSCTAWGGTCDNGTMEAAADRRKPNDCKECNPGYGLVETARGDSCEPCLLALNKFSTGGTGACADLKVCGDLAGGTR